MAIRDLRRRRQEPFGKTTRELGLEQLSSGMQGLASGLVDVYSQYNLQQEKAAQEQKKQEEEYERIMQEAQGLVERYNIPEEKALEFARMPKGSEKTAILKSIMKGEQAPRWFEQFREPTIAQKFIGTAGAPEYTQAQQAYQQAMGAQQPEIPESLQGLMRSQQMRQQTEGVTQGGLPQVATQPSSALLRNIVQEAQRAGISPEEQVQLMVQRGTLNENIGANVLRNLARGTARAGESLLETTPNILSWLGEKGAQALRSLQGPERKPVGGLFMEPSMTVAQEREARIQAEKERKTEPPIQFPRLDLKKLISDKIEKRYLPKDYLKPQSDAERQLDEFAGTVGAILAPFPGAIGAKIPGTSLKLADRAGRALGIAGAGQVAKWGAQNLGFDKNQQEYIKAGAMLTAGLIGPKVAEKIGNAQMQSGKSQLAKAKNASIKADKLNKFIDTYDRGLSTGKFKPDMQLKNQVRTMGIQEIQPSVRRLVDISIEELIDFRENLNRFAREATNESSRSFVRTLKDPLDQAIKNAGRKSKDILEGINQYYNGAQLFRASKDASKIGEFVKRWTTPRKMSSLATGALLGGGGVTGIKAGTVSLGGRFLAVPLIDNTIKLFKYPAIRKLYGRVVTNILAKNVEGSKKSLDKFNKVVKKYEKKV